MVSRLVRLVRRRGYWKPPTAAEIAEGLRDAEVKLRRELTNRARAEGEDLEKNVSYGEVLNYWAWFENFVLLFHANGTFAAIILGWERFEGDFTEPVPVDLVDSFMEMQMRAKGQRDPGSSIPGMGLSGVSMAKSLSAITRIHWQFGVAPSPTHEPRISDKRKSYLKRAKKNHHQGFDVMSLSLIATSIAQIPGWSAAKKMQMQAMHLYSFHHGHRPDSECGPYCLDVNDISLPSDAVGFDAQNLPKYVRVFYRRWKHRPVSELGEAYEQQFRRNPYAAEACPVVNILAWLAEGGHGDKGPLFGNLDKNGKILRAHHKRKVKEGKKQYDVWFTEEGKRVNYTCGQVYAMFSRVIDHCELATWKTRKPDDDNWAMATPHDWRVAFVSWVARAQADHIYAERGARFAVGSADLRTYWFLGATKRETFLNDDVEDPMFKYCPFPAQGMTYSSTDARGARSARIRAPASEGL